VAQAPVVVDVGVGHVLEGKVLQSAKGCLHGNPSGPDLFKQFGDIGWVHDLIFRANNMVISTDPAVQEAGNIHGFIMSWALYDFPIVISAGILSGNPASVFLNNGSPIKACGVMFAVFTDDFEITHNRE